MEPRDFSHNWVRMLHMYFYKGSVNVVQRYHFIHSHAGCVSANTICTYKSTFIVASRNHIHAQASQLPSVSSRQIPGGGVIREPAAMSTCGTFSASSVVITLRVSPLGFRAFGRFSRLDNQ